MHCECHSTGARCTARCKSLQCKNEKLVVKNASALKIAAPAPQPGATAIALCYQLPTSTLNNKRNHVTSVNQFGFSWMDGACVVYKPAAASTSGVITISSSLYRPIYGFSGRRLNLIPAVTKNTRIAISDATSDMCKWRQGRVALTRYTTILVKYTKNTT
jgi:hypothetical protein